MSESEKAAAWYSALEYRDMRTEAYLAVCRQSHQLAGQHLCKKRRLLSSSCPADQASSSSKSTTTRGLERLRNYGAHRADKVAAKTAVFEEQARRWQMSLERDDEEDDDSLLAEEERAALSIADVYARITAKSRHEAVVRGRQDEKEARTILQAENTGFVTSSGDSKMGGVVVQRRSLAKAAKKEIRYILGQRFDIKMFL